MNRKEAYELIKQYELEDVIKNKYGKNYTNLQTDMLITVIHEYEESLDEDDEDDDEQISAYEAACLAFLGILKDSGALEDMLAQL